MLYLYTAQIMASEAQRRHLDGVRLDGRVTDKPLRWWSFVAALFTHSAAATDHARTGLGRVAAA
jgi:hypothetical protein